MATRSLRKNSLIALAALVVTISLVRGEYWTIHTRTLPSDIAIVQETEAAGERMTPNTLLIARLGIRAPIIAMTVDKPTERAFQEALKQGVVLYPGTATVGSYGNAYIFGHSSDYLWKGGQFKTVLAALPRIKAGDIITASDGEGRIYRYVVRRTAVVSPKDTSVLSQYDHKEKLLTLQTSYPIGTALKRFIAVAALEG